MTQQALSKSPFPGFSKLANTTWFYAPPENLSNGYASVTAQPDLVILSTWMGAASKHILKYIAGYQKLFPRSPILMFTNTITDIAFRPPNYHKENLKPAIRLVNEYASSKENPQILLHLFSNGGAHHVTQLAISYRRQFNSPLPITGMILDSAPGRATYGRAVKALAIGLPKFLLFRILGLLVIHFLCTLMWIRHHILRLENIISTVRRQLVDPELFPTTAPRIYIYSKTDEMVGWEHVEWNVKQAKEIGYEVATERYEKSRHVEHLVTDPERYWGAVRSILGPQTRSPLPLQ